MTKASTSLTNFNAGILSPYLRARDDIAQFSQGAEKIENFIPLIQGPLMKRSGTQYLGGTLNNQVAELIPFIFNKDQAYVVEATEQAFRFYTRGVGDTLGIVQDGGTPVEVTTPYLASELSQIRYVQQNDVLYLVHPTHPPAQLQRFSETQWVYRVAPYTIPPFLNQNLSDTQIVASATTGSGITLTATADIFTADQVGGYWKLSESLESKHDPWEAGINVTSGNVYKNAGHAYRASTSGTTGKRPPVHTSGTESDGAIDWEYLHSGYGVVQITAYTSATTVACDVLNTLPESTTLNSGTELWSQGAFSTANGYPNTVLLFEQRLWYMGVAAAPLTVWASSVDAYADFALGTDDDDAIQFTVSASRAEQIVWATATRTLLIGTTGSEYSVTLGGTEGATPTEVDVALQTTFGAEPNTNALVKAGVTMFVQRGGTKLIEFLYSDTVDAYTGVDATLQAEDALITDGTETIHTLVDQKTPTSIVWAATQSRLIGYSFDYHNKVRAFHTHDLGGGIVSVAVIPDDLTKKDQLWCVVSRVIEGVTKYYVEVLSDDVTSRKDIAGSLYADCCTSYDGEPITTVTGLDYLEGQTVTIANSDAYLHDAVVVNGTITLTRPQASFYVGLPYTSTVRTHTMNAGASDGSSLAKTKRITHATLSFYRTGSGFLLGSTEADVYRIPSRRTTDLMDEGVPFRTGYSETLAFTLGYSNDGHVVVQHNRPLPCTLTGIHLQLVTQDR